MNSHFNLLKDSNREVKVLVVDQINLERPYELTMLRPPIDNRKDFLMALELLLVHRGTSDVSHLVIAFRPPAGPDRFVPVTSEDVLDDAFYQDYYFGTDIPRLMVFQTRCHTRNQVSPYHRFTDEPEYVQQQDTTDGKLIPKWTILQVRKLQHDLDATLPLDVKPTLSAPDFIGVPLMVPVHENDELSRAEVNWALKGMWGYRQPAQSVELSRIIFVENSNADLCRRLPADVTVRDATTVTPGLRFLPLLTVVLPSDLVDLFSRISWSPLKRDSWPDVPGAWKCPPSRSYASAGAHLPPPHVFGAPLVPKVHGPSPKSAKCSWRPPAPNTPLIIKPAIPAMRLNPQSPGAAVQVRVPMSAMKVVRDVATCTREDDVPAVADVYPSALESQQQCQQGGTVSRGTKRGREESAVVDEEEGEEVVSKYRSVRQRTSKDGFKGWCRRTAATAAAIGHFALTRVVPLVAGVALTTVALTAAVEMAPNNALQLIIAGADMDMALLEAVDQSAFEYKFLA